MILEFPSIFTGDISLLSGIAKGIPIFIISPSEKVLNDIHSLAFLFY
jgi:hypothetical protein